MTSPSASMLLGLQTLSERASHHAHDDTGGTRKPSYDNSEPAVAEHFNSFRDLSGLGQKNSHLHCSCTRLVRRFVSWLMGTIVGVEIMGALVGTLK